jgi:pimeloyl-ACP methyl ester carboxylesterase
MPSALNTSQNRRQHYLEGFTPLTASRAEPRCSYCLFVPKSALAPEAQPKLVVSIHGTGRSIEQNRQALAGFARWHSCIVLCPLFPAGIFGDGNLSGYKYLIENDLRYDQVLLAVVDEVAERYGVTFPDFALCGYSGGGHFVHRFLILHPQRLSAAAIGAPGSVTLLDRSQPWWVGIADAAQLFGIEPDLEAIKRVPVQMVVGAADLETWEITHAEGSRYWMPRANEAGRTRPERLEALRASFAAAGIPVEFEVIPGMAHDEERFTFHVQNFLAAHL